MYVYQNVMAEFVKIEMMFHAKALEMYTQCCHSLHTQSHRDDLQVGLQGFLYSSRGGGSLDFGLIGIDQRSTKSCLKNSVPDSSDMDHRL